MTPADSITVTWHCDDVLEMRPDSTADQASAVLRKIESKYYASVGITWDVIACWSEEMYPEE